ncbi:hypothetical protein [Halovulum sp. GXIMD14793]
MDAIQILTVENVFRLSDRRCIVVPDFPILNGIRGPLMLDACLMKNTGVSVSCKLELTVTHFNIRGESDVDKRWHLTPRLFQIDTNSISVGDIVAVYDAEIADMLLQSTNASPRLPS